MGMVVKMGWSKPLGYYDDEHYIKTKFVLVKETPNCYKTKLFYTDEDNPKIKMNYSVWNIIAVEDIKEGEELTVTYTFYKI